ncbi:MAG: hypothetical protein IPL39_14405 [Opitutaceae bacterium]|nr:hypothetical protein [Opitutaceae bacterium]
MTSAYFSTPERIATLEATAAAWLSTPYVQSGAVRGSGASCHMLAAAVLRDTCCPLPPPPDRGTTRLREYTTAMRTWLDSQPTHFAPVPLEALAAGDVLLCEIGCGHIGLYLGDPGARALQVLRHTPAHIVSLHDPQVRAHLVAAWRPLDPSIT